MANRRLRPDSIVVTGLGMVSSLGGVVQSCAAARAGILRCIELQDSRVFDEDEPFKMVPLRGHPVRGLTDGFQGLARSLRLVTAALKDLMSYAGLEARDARTTGLLLNLGHGYFRQCQQARQRQRAEQLGLPVGDLPDLEEERERYRGRFFPRLEELSSVAFHSRHRRLSFEGPAGFFPVMEEAIRSLRAREQDWCVVGGVDSYLEPELLQVLLGLRMLKTPDQPVGFLPGEGAALVLLERYEHATRRGARIEALVGAPSVGQDSHHRFSGRPNTGAMLVQTLRGFLQQPELGNRRIGLNIGSLNGDEWRAREWGMSLVKLGRELEGARQWNPAESFGETGAATAAFATCMAVRALQRAYARTEDVLVWASGEDGRKGAIGIHAL
ncbi:beta-ketoacyl synthase N-terminal-like domain-containing protein [Archangium gephyra]|uniref:beta-ketoacyl synthase N-terminal-like domain-containing protein n=1 Tax=Archangium gephyra TaxID=48 RepID=UPI003B780D3B